MPCAAIATDIVLLLAVTPAAALPGSSVLQVLADVAKGRIKVLFVSPERLNNPHLLEALRPCMPLPLVVVDEAHCVAGTQGWCWGRGGGGRRQGGGRGGPAC